MENTHYRKLTASVAQHFGETNNSLCNLRGWKITHEKKHTASLWCQHFILLFHWQWAGIYVDVNIWYVKANTAVRSVTTNVLKVGGKLIIKERYARISHCNWCCFDYINTHTHTHMRKHTHRHTHTHTHTHAHAHLYAPLHLHTYTSTRTCTHTISPTHTYMHTCIQSNDCAWLDIIHSFHYHAAHLVTTVHF